MERVEEQGSVAPATRAELAPVAHESGTWRARIVLFLERTVFYSLLFIIALTAIPYGTVEPWWQSLFECLIFALVALWIIEGMLRGAWEISGRSLLIPLGAIIIYAFIQTLPVRALSGNNWPTISADPYGTRLVALKVLAIALAGALLWRYTSSRRRLRVLIYAVLITAVVSALFGIIRETTHHNAPGFLLPQLRPQSGYGQFINRNHFAYLMEMALGLALGLAIGRGEQRDRLIYIAAALPVWMALVLANSRGGILSMLSQLLFLALMYSALRPAQDAAESQSQVWLHVRNVTSKLPVRIALILVLLGAMVLGVLWIGGDPLAKRLETLQGEVASEDAEAGEGARRIHFWQATLRMFKDHPVTGIGFGSYWIAITEYYDVPGKKRPYEAHNDYLELLVSGGIIGVGLFVWFIIAFIKRVRNTLLSQDAFRRAACLGALTGLFGVAVHSLVDFGLHITINALVCMALICIATTDERVEDRTRLLPGRLRHRGKPEIAA
jgi:O-antigen ligase